MQDGHQEDLAILMVEVEGLRCGLPLSDVAELHPVVASVPLPGAPAIVDGAIDVRGSVVAVLDVRTRLALPRRQPLLSDHLVVSRIGPRTVALRVDRAVDLTTVPRSCIDSTEHLGGTAYLSGVARLADGLVLIHDLAAFLSADEAAALDEALAGAGDEPGIQH
ncbi:MAG TPA: chemotaxis protein CheW [Acidimicrobiales bacterium]|nr:chemotaxis protein CheW [Acidimicrobiales bacterium]